MLKRDKINALKTLKLSFIRKGYVRIIPGKSYEVRFFPKDNRELNELQKCIRTIGFNVSNTFLNKGKVVLPLYDKVLSLKFQKIKLIVTEKKNAILQANSANLPEKKKPRPNVIKKQKKVPAKLLNQYKKTNPLKYIETIVCYELSIPSKELKSPSRLQELVLARQLIMYFARTYTSASFAKVGIYLGGRNHATILFGCNKIKALMKSNPEIKALVRKLTLKFN